MKKQIVTLFQTISLSLKITPISSLVMVFYYLFEAVVPAIIIIVTADLFDSVFRYISTGNSENFSNVIQNSFIIFSIYLFQQLFDLISNLVINMGVYEKFIHYSRIKVSEKAAKIKLIDFEDAEVLNKRQRALECIEYEKLSQMFMSFTVCVTSFFSVISIAITLMQYSIYFLPITFFSVLPYLIIRFIRGKEFYYMKYHQAKKTRMLEYLWNLFISKESGKELRVFGFGNYLEDKYKKVRNEVATETWNFNVNEAKSLFICDIIRVIGFGLCIALSIYLTSLELITVAVLGASISAFSNMQEQTKAFLIELAFLPDLLRYANDYFEFLHLPENNDEDLGEVIFDKAISLVNISFKYPSSSELSLKDINLEISKGSTVVIIGENGSGKTTLSKIIQNLYRPFKGNVKVDGVILKNNKRWYEKISIVNQEFMKLYLKIKNNINISSIEKVLTKELYTKYVQDMQLHELLQLQEGMNTQIGKDFDGIELSGGQWQKLVIARGSFRESELVILDEPTSAIDPLVENEIFTQFLQKTRNKTKIIISHKVGLSKFADKILVMSKGNIIEEGTHEELIEKHKEYYRMYHSQSQWYQ